MEKAALERRHEHEQDQAADDGFGHGPDPLIRLGGEDRCKGRRSIVLQLIRIDFGPHKETRADGGVFRETVRDRPLAHVA